VIVSTCRQCPGWFRGGRRAGLLLPGPLADKGHQDYLFVAAFKGAGHRTQLRWIGNVAGLDGRPLRCLHPGQAGNFFNRMAAGLSGFLDADAKKPAPRLPAGEREIILNVKT
jgi:hypothetical protein